MELKDRIRAFIEYKGLTVRKFEEDCGMSNGYISAMRKGLGIEKLNNVLSRFPELNRDWLLYGEGEMLKSQILHSDGSTVVGANINGSGNKIMHNNLSEIKMLVNEMAEQRKANSALMQKKDEQIDRLLSIVEKFQK